MALSVRGWTIHHVSVFVLTFMGYAYFHATRKTFSNIKTTLSAEWTPSFSNETVNRTLPDQIWNTRHLFADGKSAEYFLGALDTAFLLSYAVGLFISGAVGDRLDLRLVLSFGMCSSAVCVFIFGVLSQVCHIYNPVYYMIFWILNGLLQSTGWPAMVAVMANWFGKSSRGFVFGVWSACASVGNIIGALMASSVLDFGYEYAFLVPASVLFGGGVMIFFGLVTHPSEVGLQSPDGEETPQVEPSDNATVPLLEDEEAEEEHPDTIRAVYPQHQKDPIQKPKEAMNFLKAVLLPGVIPYSLSYACLKLVNYAFFFWLPFYLTNKFGWAATVADKISIWYDVGGIIGGAVGGFVSDRVGLRATVVNVMLLGALPSLYGYSLSPNSETINAVLMAVTGFWIGGPANLISSAIAADIGKQGLVSGNKEALATVTGIVDGTGSVGAAAGQLLVPLIQLHLGWHFVFYLFMLMTVLTIICVAPMLREWRETAFYRRRWGALPSPQVQSGDHDVIINRSVCS